MSAAIDMLGRLFSLIDLVDYDTMIVLPKQRVISMEGIMRNTQSVVILFDDEEEQGAWRYARNVYFFSTKGIPGTAFWMDLIKGNVHRDTLVKIKSLITKDLKEVNIVARESPKDALLTYELLNELRRINAEARVKVLLDVPSLDNVLNIATLMAIALYKGLLDAVAIANVGRIAAKMHALNDLERARELRWCLTNLARAADRALGDNVHVTAAVCYSTNVPEIFKDLSGFIRFSRFASWGMEYQSSGMYGTIEGPTYIVNEDQLRELARKEGWIREGVEIGEGHRLRVAALDVNAHVLRELLQSASTQASGREGSTMTGYVELYRVASYIESLIKKLWG